MHDAAGQRVKYLVIRNVVWGAVLLLAVLTGWVMQTGLGLERTFLSTDYYHTVLEETDGESLQTYFLEAASSEFENYSLWDESMIHRALVRTADEAWLKEQAAYAAGEYLLFVKGEQEQLVIAVDLRERRQIFLEELNKELARHYPELFEEVSAEFFDQLLSRLEIAEELTLIELEDKEELNPEFKAELAKLDRARTYMEYIPWFSGAALALVGFMWFGPAGMLKVLGLGALFSGLTYLYLWPLGWDRMVVPLVERLVADWELAGLVWAQQEEIMRSLAGDMFSRISIYLSAAGAAALAGGFALHRGIGYFRGPGGD